MHWMPVLLPYLAGAGSAFAVDFLIQVYVKPRTDRRARRDERWERDVLDLGSLMAAEVSTAAQRARGDQFLYRAMRDFPVPTMRGDPEQERRQQEISARREREIWEQRQKAVASTDAFTELVRSRVRWTADMVIDFEPRTPVIVAFVRAAYLYQLQVQRLVTSATFELPADSLEETWAEEGKWRLGTIFELKALARLRHAPRVSKRWQLLRARRRAVALTRLRHAAPESGLPAGGAGNEG